MGTCSSLKRGVLSLWVVFSFVTCNLHLQPKIICCFLFQFCSKHQQVLKSLSGCLYVYVHVFIGVSIFIPPGVIASLIHSSLNTGLNRFNPAAQPAFFHHHFYPLSILCFLLLSFSFLSFLLEHSSSHIVFLIFWHLPERNDVYVDVIT